MSTVLLFDRWPLLIDLHLDGFSIACQESLSCYILDFPQHFITIYTFTEARPSALRVLFSSHSFWL